MTAKVDVQIACDEGGIPESDAIVSWVTRAVEASGHNVLVDALVSVSVRIVDAAEIRTLNRDYRGQDKATNVLSFSAGEIAGLPSEAERPLGDVIVCASVVSDEASEQGKELNDHWAHMIVHGTLHLLGFDHATNEQAAEMEGLETQILNANGVDDPYRETPQET